MAADYKQAIAPDYISKALKPDELTKRLKNLAELLRKAPQTPNPALATLVKALVDPALLRHKSAEIQLLTACALAEILRIYAPECPYSDRELKAIFDLFISQLPGAAKAESPFFSSYFQLLESCSGASTFLLLHNLEDGSAARSAEEPTQLQRLFHTIFDMGKEECTSAVEYCALEILTKCIEEAQGGEDLGGPMLDALLLQLTPAVKAANPTGFRMAIMLLRRCSQSLRSGVSKFVEHALFRLVGNTKHAGSDKKSNAKGKRPSIKDKLAGNKAGKAKGSAKKSAEYDMSESEQSDGGSSDDGDDDATGAHDPSDGRFYTVLKGSKVQLNVVRELCVHCPEMVVSSEFNLQDMVQCGDVNARLEIASLLGQAFADPLSSLQSHNPALFEALLKRFDDAHISVRLRLAEMAGSLLLRYPDANTQVPAHNPVDAGTDTTAISLHTSIVSSTPPGAQLCMKLTERAHDTHEKVRRAVIAGVCEAAVKDPNCVTGPLMLAVGERCLDKKPLVRREALLQLATVFAKNCGSYWKKGSALPKGHVERYRWIPKRMLAAWQTAHSSRLVVESLFDEVVLDKQDTVEERAHCLLAIHTKLDQRSRDILFAMMKARIALSTYVSRLLLVRSKLKEDASNAGLLAARAKLLAQINSLCPERSSGVDGDAGAADDDAPQSSRSSGAGGPGLLLQLLALKDKNVCRWLSQITAYDTPYEMIRTAKKELVRAVAASSSGDGSSSSKGGSTAVLVDYVKKLMTRLSMSLLPIDAVPTVFKMIGVVSALREVAISSGVLLRAVGQLAPQLLSGSYVQSAKLFLQHSEVSASMSMQYAPNSAEADAAKQKAPVLDDQLADIMLQLLAICRGNTLPGATAADRPPAPIKTSLAGARSAAAVDAVAAAASQELAHRLLQVLTRISVSGPRKQPKLAVRAIRNLYPDLSRDVLADVLKLCGDQLTLSSSPSSSLSLRSALCGLRELAKSTYPLYSSESGRVFRFIVERLLPAADSSSADGDGDEPDEHDNQQTESGLTLREEAFLQAKIYGLKLLVAHMLGLDDVTVSSQNISVTAALSPQPGLAKAGDIHVGLKALFQVITSSGASAYTGSTTAAGPSGDGDDSSADEPLALKRDLITTAAGKAIIRLCSQPHVARSVLKPHNLRVLADKVSLGPRPDLRFDFASYIIKRLRSSKSPLPFRFAVLTVFTVLDADYKPQVQQLKKQLALAAVQERQRFEERQQQLQQSGEVKGAGNPASPADVADDDGDESPVKAVSTPARPGTSSSSSRPALLPLFGVQPELALADLVHLLAHQPSFDYRNKDEDLDYMRHCIEFFLETVLVPAPRDLTQSGAVTAMTAGSAEAAQGNNHGLIWKILSLILKTTDADTRVPATSNIYAAADVGLIVLAKHGKDYSSYPGDIMLPPELYRIEATPESAAELQRVRKRMELYRKHVNAKGHQARSAGAMPAPAAAASPRKPKSSKAVTARQHNATAGAGTGLARAASPGTKASSSKAASKREVNADDDVDAKQPAATSAPKRKAGKAKVAKPAAAAGTPSTPARERIPRHAKQLAEGKLAEGPSSGDEEEDADHHDQAPSDDDDGSSDHEPSHTKRRRTLPAVSKQSLSQGSGGTAKPSQSSSVMTSATIDSFDIDLTLNRTPPRPLHSQLSARPSGTPSSAAGHQSPLKRKAVSAVSDVAPPSSSTAAAGSAGIKGQPVIKRSRVDAPAASGSAKSKSKSSSAASAVVPMDATSSASPSNKENSAAAKRKRPAAGASSDPKQSTLIIKPPTVVASGAAASSAALAIKKPNTLVPVTASSSTAEPSSQHVDDDIPLTKRKRKAVPAPAVVASSSVDDQQSEPTNPAKRRPQQAELEQSPPQSSSELKPAPVMLTTFRRARRS